jgi:pimeloyl-ACP methyl ester carboxylesterase
MRPNLVKGIIALEPSGPPFTRRPPLGSGPAFPFGLTDLPIAYDPPAGPNAENLSTVTIPAPDASHYESILQAEPAKKLVNLSKVPTLVVTAEASYHAPYDHCTVQFLRQAGVDVEHADLGKEGIKGNGHMLFMEKNNIEIAERVYQWLEKQT